MNGGVLGKIIAQTAKAVDEPSVLGGLLNYRSANKELKDAVNFRLYDENPGLFHTDSGEKVFGEGFSDKIPRMHVDDLKEMGYEENIPTRYKRKTGKRDLDELASFAGFDDTDGRDRFLESIMQELDTRNAGRNAKVELSQLRNDPKFLARVKKDLENEKAMYAPEPAAFEPGKRDLQWYMKNVAIPKSKVTQIEVKAPQQTGMENFKINRNDISHTIPESVIKYFPSNHSIPVRNLTPKPQSIAQPQPTPGVVPLGKQPMEQSPDWPAILASVLGTKIAIGE